MRRVRFVRLYQLKSEHLSTYRRWVNRLRFPLRFRFVTAVPKFQPHVPVVKRFERHPLRLTFGEIKRTNFHACDSNFQVPVSTSYSIQSYYKIQIQLKHFEHWNSHVRGFCQRAKYVKKKTRNTILPFTTFCFFRHKRAVTLHRHCNRCRGVLGTVQGFCLRSLEITRRWYFNYSHSGTLAKQRFAFSFEIFPRPLGEPIPLTNSIL